MCECVGTFVPAAGVFRFSFSWIPFHGAGKIGGGRETLQRLNLRSSHYFIVVRTAVSCLFYFSFLFSCHTQPANAMRQLFQTTISLCGRGCGSHTVLSSFFLSFFFFPSSLCSGHPPPPSSPRGRRSFSCVTAQSRYMRKCVHGKAWHTTTGFFAFPTCSFLFLFPFPCPLLHFLLGYPSLLLGDREWWPVG